ADNGVPEVEGQYATEPVDELLDQGTVDAELAAHLCHLLFRRRFPENASCRVTRHETQHQENQHRDEEHLHNQRQQSSGDECSHVYLSNQISRWKIGIQASVWT